jgi:RNA-binding protein
MTSPTKNTTKNTPKNTSKTSRTLTGQQRRHLRKLAHTLKAIVFVGEAGVSGGVLAALEQALSDHELVKLRLLNTEDRKITAEQIASASSAELCGVVGRSVILYRARDENPTIVLPARGDQG